MNSLRIGYQDIKIIRESSGLAECLGKYDTETAEIHINEKHSDREVVNTLLHEILHAIWHTYGIHGFDDEKQEQVCNALANGLTQVFLDNKQLLTTIGKGLHE